MTNQHKLKRSQQHSDSSDLTRRVTRSGARQTLSGPSRKNFVGIVNCPFFTLILGHQLGRRNKMYPNLCRQLLILVKYFQAPPLLGSVSYSDWISSPPTSPVYPPYTTLHQATNEYSLWLSRMEKYYVYLAERIPWMSSSRFRSVYLVVSLNDAKQQSTQDILEIFADNDIPH